MGTMPIGVIALAISLGILVLIVILSLRGPRDRGGRLPDAGPIIPHGHGHLDDGDGFGEDG